MGKIWQESTFHVAVCVSVLAMVTGGCGTGTAVIEHSPELSTEYPSQSKSESQLYSAPQTDSKELVNASSPFAAPMLIHVGSQPMNADDKIKYPSPAIFDIDDDGKDEMVIGSIYGDVYVCENQSGTKEPKWSAPKILKTSDNQPLKLKNWWCVGMSPQLVDMNADGYNDMVMSTFEGTAFLVEGSEHGFNTPEHIVDAESDNVRISMYFDNDAGGYRHVDRSTDGEQYFRKHQLTSIAVVDWENDGDLDLLLGAYQGALYLCKNNGSATRPEFAVTNRQIKADGKMIKIRGGLATPRVCDWNQDGLFDILCGRTGGGVLYYRNVGRKGAPEFAAADTLVALAEDSRVVNGFPTQPTKSFHIDPGDYDGDGDLDLLVGGLCHYEEEKVLTAKERQELDSINERMRELQQRIDNTMAKARTGNEARKLNKSKSVQEMRRELASTRKRQRQLSPLPAKKVRNLIWLYRNNTATSNSKTK